MAFDLSDFDSLLSQMEQEEAKSPASATASNRRSTPEDLAFELFGSNAELVIRSGLGFSSETIKVPQHKPGAKSFDRPDSLKPRAGKNGCEYSAAGNKAAFIFRICVMALAGQNGGKIATVDFVALFIGANCAEYKLPWNSSILAAAKPIAKSLNRAVTVSPEWVTFEGLKPSPDLARFRALANKLVQTVRASVKVPAIKSTAKAPTK